MSALISYAIILVFGEFCLTLTVHLLTVDIYLVFALQICFRQRCQTHGELHING